MEKEIKDLQDKLDALKLKYEQSKQPFKNGDVVKINSSCGSAIILITNYENRSGYGFNSLGEWYNSDRFHFKSNPELWQLATSKEWLEALTKEAVKRGLVKDNYALFGKLKDKRIITSDKYWLNDQYYLCNGNDILMKNGVWTAEVIKEETLEELAEKYSEKYDLATSWNYITFFNENKETINRLSK